MDEKLWLKAQKLATQNYSVVVINEKTPSGQSIYLARNPELYGCMAQGVSPEEAINNLNDARIDYIFSFLKDNVKIPEPAPRPFQTLDTSFIGVSGNQFNIVEQIQFRESKDFSNQPSDSKSLYKVSVKA